MGNGALRHAKLLGDVVDAFFPICSLVGVPNILKSSANASNSFWFMGDSFAWFDACAFAFSFIWGLSYHKIRGFSRRALGSEFLKMAVVRVMENSHFDIRNDPMGESFTENSIGDPHVF